IEPFVGDIFQRNEAIKRAMQLIGKPYDLVNFNCEHYANTVQHNKSYSKQVNIGLVAGLIALVLSIGFTR
ncbi:MAG TPA: lecithin retinol acyltransferase family protein, partial [Niabella sp.]|nr:lecithin retinol acyltransferase family protein [Niabella sp.]